MTQEALKLALEWAEANGEIVFAGGGMDAVNKMNSWATAIKEALAQPQRTWVGLTEEEVLEFTRASWGVGVTASEFIRAIEAKLKEKNT